MATYKFYTSKGFRYITKRKRDDATVAINMFMEEGESIVTVSKITVGAERYKGEAGCLHVKDLRNA